MLFGEKAASRVLEIQYAHHLALVDQRNRQFRPRLGICLHVTRILGHIGGEHSLLLLRRVAHDPASQRNLVLEVDILVEAQRESMLQLLPRRIEQQDAEHLVINQAPHQFGDAPQQFVKIQDRCELTGDLIQQKQDARLLSCPCIELGVLAARCHTRPNESENANVFLAESAGLARLDVDHSDHSVLGDQRNGQLRTYVWDALDVAGILTNVIDQHGLTRLRGDASDALADFDPAAFSEFGRIADLKAEAHLLRLFVQQKNGENFVINDLADDFCYTAQGGVQIERRRQHVGYVEQQRLDRQAIRLGDDRTH